MSNAREGIRGTDKIMIGDHEIPKITYYALQFSTTQRKMVVKILNCDKTQKFLYDTKQETQPFTHYDSEGIMVNHYHVEVDTIREINKPGWIATTVIVFNIVA